MVNVNDNGPFSSEYLNIIDSLERYYKFPEEFLNDMSFNIDIEKLKQTVEKFR